MRIMFLALLLAAFSFLAAITEYTAAFLPENFPVDAGGQQS